MNTQQLVMNSQGIDDLQVGMILPGSNEPLVQEDIDYILGLRGAEETVRNLRPSVSVYRGATTAAPNEPPFPPAENGPYGPDPAWGNTGDVPLAGALCMPSIGAANLNKQLFQNLLTNARMQDVPYVPGVAYAGFAHALDQAECDWLNSYFAGQP